MLKKKIQEIIIGGSNVDNFEKIFVLYTSLVLATFGFFAIFLNASLEIANELVIIAVVTFVSYLSIYLYGRFTTNIIFLKVAISIISFILANIFWIYNYNSRGPVLYLFVVYLSLMLFIWDSKSFLYLFLLILANIVVFFAIEYFYPDILDTYPDEKARIWDIYTGLIIYLSVIYIYTTAAKNNYMRQYKKAKESEQLKSAFLHNLSHEIRTPLNAIVGFSSLVIEEEATKEDKQNYKKIITENSDLLLRLIEDIIDMSMIETNQLSIKKTNINLNSLLKHLNDIFQAQIINKQKNITLLVEFGDEEGKLDTDRTRLEQIFINLLNNAVKFTHSGIIKFGCKVDNKVVCFFVQDTGIGIKPEFQDKIFDRFIKAHENRDTVYRGAGMGLFLTKKMVGMLGGKIWVESEYEKGSTFCFTIPVS